MADKMFPNVLLLGNGLNLGFSNAKTSLNDLLKNVTNEEIKKIFDEIKQADKNSNSSIKHNKDSITFPLETVIRTGNDIEKSLKEIHENMYGTVDNDEQRIILQDILTAGFDDILTTNYSYELEIAGQKFSKTADLAKEIKKLMRYNLEGDMKGAENKYLLHTYNEVVSDTHANRIWHIHGEARKYSSMIIGHYDYGTLLYKYKELCQKRKNNYKWKQINNEKINYTSWIDSFIMGNVYILGFRLDFSEMDIWWLINRKNREKAETGKVYFYEPKEENFIDLKLHLLESYGVEIVDLGMTRKSGSDFDFKLFYKKAIQDIKEKMATT